MRSNENKSLQFEPILGEGNFKSVDFASKLFKPTNKQDTVTSETIYYTLLLKDFNEILNLVEAKTVFLSTSNITWILYVKTHEKGLEENRCIPGEQGKGQDIPFCLRFLPLCKFMI